MVAPPEPRPEPRAEEVTAHGAGWVRLAVRTYPAPRAGAPALLLHHGLASSARIWDLMLPRLARAFRVVTYDARGHGRSGKPSHGYGFEHAVVDALAVMDAAGVRRPIVVGHSWGAMVALELAARHPRRLTGAVLVDGGLAGPPWDWPTTRERLSPPPLAGMTLRAFRREVARRSPVPVTPEIEAAVLSLMHVHRDGTIRPRLSRRNHLRILHAIWRQRPLELYPRLRVPVLVIVARDPDGDPAWTRAKRRNVAAARTTAAGRPVTFGWMRGVHDLPLQHPDRLSRRIERFAHEVVG